MVVVVFVSPACVVVPGTAIVVRGVMIVELEFFVLREGESETVTDEVVVEKLVIMTAEEEVVGTMEEDIVELLVVGI